MTHGNASLWLNVRLPSLPKWHWKESADTLDTQRNKCTSPRLTQSVDSRADSTSVQHATHRNCQHLRSSTVWNLEFTNRIYVFASRSSLCGIFQGWWGYRAWYQFSSRYADWWRLVHYVLCGNASNIQFEDNSSRLSNPATDDEHWPKDMGHWRLLL